MHVWYVDAGIEDTPEPVYTHCLVLSRDVMDVCYILSVENEGNARCILKAIALKTVQNCVLQTVE